MSAILKPAAAPKQPLSQITDLKTLLEMHAKRQGYVKEAHNKGNPKKEEQKKQDLAACEKQLRATGYRGELPEPIMPTAKPARDREAKVGAFDANGFDGRGTTVKQAKAEAKRQNLEFKWAPGAEKVYAERMAQRAANKKAKKPKAQKQGGGGGGSVNYMVDARAIPLITGRSAAPSQGQQGQQPKPKAKAGKGKGKGGKGGNQKQQPAAKAPKQKSLKQLEEDLNAAETQAIKWNQLRSERKTVDSKGKPVRADGGPRASAFVSKKLDAYNSLALRTEPSKARDWNPQIPPPASVDGFGGAPGRSGIQYAAESKTAPTSVTTTITAPTSLTGSAAPGVTHLQMPYSYTKPPVFSHSRP